MHAYSLDVGEYIEQYVRLDSERIHQNYVNETFSLIKFCLRKLFNFSTFLGFLCMVHTYAFTVIFSLKKISEQK